jgi:hypothetical protein
MQLNGYIVEIKGVNNYVKIMEEGKYQRGRVRRRPRKRPKESFETGTGMKRPTESSGMFFQEGNEYSGSKKGEVLNISEQLLASQ